MSTIIPVDSIRDRRDAAKQKYRTSAHGRAHEYAYNKARRLADPHRHRLEVRRGYRRKKERAIEIKGGVCTDCKKAVHPSAFDFHHVDPTTKDATNTLMLRSWEAILAEIDKCILLCANCHRVRHFKWENEEIQV